MARHPSDRSRRPATDAHATIGDAATLSRITRARATTATLRCVERLRHRTFADLLDARAADEALFLIAYDEGGARSELSHAGLVARVSARARTLAGAGIRRGDRIATLLPNDPEVPVTCLAAWRLGATVVPINLGEDDERIGYVLGNAEARLALVLRQPAERVASLRARAGSPDTWIRLDDLREPAGDADAAGAPRPDPEDEALIVYTSGTTGAPKGVVLTQQNLLVDAQEMARWHRFDRDTRLMCVLPTHHVNGLVVTLVTPFLVGASTVLLPRFRTEDFWRRAADEGVHVASVVPTLLAFLLEDEGGRRGLDLSRFRHLICGAGPLTVELGRRFEETFGIRIVHGYGLSETTCYSCFLPLDLCDGEHARWMRDFGFPSIGVPLDANEMAIHDASGREVAPGERGEIVIRGVNVMKGYYRRPDANAETFAHGWFRSGDEGFHERDASGRRFFFITGRMKELIIRGGVNLSPFEIDEVLNGVPGVERGLAVGFENEWYGEEVGAYVRLAPGAATDADAILAACREVLPFSKSPKVVVFGDEIPVTPTGKYQRNRLKHLFAEHRATQFREARR